MSALSTSNSPAKLSFQQSLAEALPLMPRHREKNKRTKSLTLDDLIDDQRRQNKLHSSSLDLLLMSYRYKEVFDTHIKQFLRKTLKPKQALDLWQLVFTALLTRDHLSEGNMIYESLELTKSLYGQYMVGALRAFCTKISEKKILIKQNIEADPTQLLPVKLFNRWNLKNHAFTPPISDIALTLSHRPEAGIWAFDQNLNWKKHNASDFNVHTLQAMNEGSWHYMQKLFENIKLNTNLQILDMCAAPGGKMIALLLWAQKKEIKIEMTGVEAKFKRHESLKNNLKRWHLSAESYLHAWGEDKLTDWAKNKVWDYVIIDLPCSGTGTLAQRPDLLYKDIENEIPALNKVQKAIIDDWKKLKTKNTFLSVCSVDPIEIEFISQEIGVEPFFNSSLINSRSSEHIVAWKVCKE
jgi:hypothetical protein